MVLMLALLGTELCSWVTQEVSGVPLKGRSLRPFVIYLESEISCEMSESFSSIHPPKILQDN